MRVAVLILIVYVSVPVVRLHSWGETFGCTFRGTYVVHVTGTALWAVVVSGADVMTSVEDSELLGSSRAGIPGDSYCVGHAEKGRKGEDAEQIHCAETNVLD